MKLISAAALALLATPAVAQTDDLITNDIIRMLAWHGRYVAMADRCATATGNDPAVAAAFAGFIERSQPWVIIGVTTLGGRGVENAAHELGAARDREIGFLANRFESDADPVKTCRELATTIGTLDISDFHLSEARRIEEARDGKRPVLDLAAVPEVRDAMELWQMYSTRQSMIIRCGTVTGDKERWSEALDLYSDRNFETHMEARGVLFNWGAMAMSRLEAVADQAYEDATRLIDGPEGLSTCAEMLALIGEGGIDIRILAPELVGRVLTARSP